MFLTAAGGVREWHAEVKADTAEEAAEMAMRAFLLSRPGLILPEIVGFDLEPKGAYR